MTESRKLSWLKDGTLKTCSNLQLGSSWGKASREVVDYLLNQDKNAGQSSLRSNKMKNKQQKQKRKLEFKVG